MKRIAQVSLLTLLLATRAYSFNLKAPEFATFWAGPELSFVVTQDPSVPKAAFESESAQAFTLNRPVPSFGYTNTKYAARLDLVNDTADDIVIHLVVYGPIERFFVQTQDTTETASAVRLSGMFTPPMPNDDLQFRYPNFKTTLRPGKNSIFLGEEAVAPHFPILIMSERSYLSFVINQDMVTAGFLAVSALILLLALVVAAVLREKFSIMFATWLLFSQLFNFFIIGAFKPFFYEIAGPGFAASIGGIEQFVYRNWIIWWGLTQVFSILFGAFFLKVPIRGKSFQSRAVQVGLVSSVLLAALSGASPVLAINVFSPPYLLVVAIFCLRSWTLVRSGYRPAFCLLVGWGVYTIATSLTLSYYFGVIGPSFLTSWGIAFANLAQAVSLGTAIFWERKHRETEALVQIQRNFRELAERDQIIQEYASSKIVSEISLGVDPRLYKSRWSDLAILFSDMRDFTTLIEKADLPTVEEILNTYIGEIVECTFDFNGEVNKMIGDAVLCIFEDPKTCLNATIALRKRLSDLNRTRVANGSRPIKFGSGVSHSRVISMNVGRLGKKLDRTVIGDEVNIAARIEAMTKELFVDVLVSEKFRERVIDYPFQRSLGQFMLKGKTTILTLHEIFGHNSERVIDYKLSTIPRLKQISDLCEGEAYEDADRLLLEMIANCPPHSFLEGQIMDRTLSALRNRIAPHMARRLRKA